MNNSFFLRQECDYKEYPHDGDMCLWKKGKEGIREIYSVDEDEWYELNPREEYLDSDLTEPSRLEIIKKKDSYAGMIFVIDWNLSSETGGRRETVNAVCSVHCDYDKLLIFDDSPDSWLKPWDMILISKHFQEFWLKPYQSFWHTIKLYLFADRVLHIQSPLEITIKNQTTHVHSKE